jgi:hypothetical protein
MERQKLELLSAVSTTSSNQKLLFTSTIHNIPFVLSPPYNPRTDMYINILYLHSDIKLNVQIKIIGT